MTDRNKCYNCNFYKPYYTKGYKQFDKCNLGLCGNRRQTVEKDESCDKFCYKVYVRLDRKQSALAALTENINILSDLKQILEEDDDELLDELVANYKRQKRK